VLLLVSSLVYFVHELSEVIVVDAEPAWSVNRPRPRCETRVGLGRVGGPARVGLPAGAGSCGRRVPGALDVLYCACAPV